MCKLYFIIGIFFCKQLKLWPYGQVIDYFFHLLLLQLCGYVAIVKSLYISLLNDIDLKSLTNIKTYKLNSFWIFFLILF